MPRRLSTTVRDAARCRHISATRLGHQGGRSEAELEASSFTLQHSVAGSRFSRVAAAWMAVGGGVV